MIFRFRGNTIDFSGKKEELYCDKLFYFDNKGNKSNIYTYVNMASSIREYVYTHKSAEFLADYDRIVSYLAQIAVLSDDCRNAITNNNGCPEAIREAIYSIYKGFGLCDDYKDDLDYHLQSKCVEYIDANSFESLNKADEFKNETGLFGCIDDEEGRRALSEECFSILIPNNLLKEVNGAIGFIAKKQYDDINQDIVAMTSSILSAIGKVDNNINYGLGLGFIKMGSCGLHEESIYTFNKLLQTLIYMLNCSSMRRDNYIYYDKVKIENGIETAVAVHERAIKIIESQMEL